MRHDEVEQLKNRLFQKEQLLLASRAGLAAAMVDHFGGEAEEVIRNFLKKGTSDWAANGAQADIRANKENDIQGLVNFLWEPLRQEGFEFTSNWNELGCQMKVTRCPIAEIARALKVEKWGFIFYCWSDEAICEGYNPEIRFRRTKTLMEGDEYCDHFYCYEAAARAVNRGNEDDAQEI
jgi:predicted ArsR family transcriptional regulator